MSNAAGGGPEIIMVIERRIRQYRAGESQIYHPRAHGITLFMEGDLVMRHDGAEVPRIKPLLWFIPARTEVFEQVSPPSHTRYVIFDWPQLQVKAVGKLELQFKWEDNLVVTSRWKIPDAPALARLVELMSELKTMHAVRTLPALLRAQALLLQLLSLYLELPAGDKDKLGHRALAHFQRSMAQQAEQPLAMSELAQHAGVSESYLRAICRKQLGLSPLQYRTRLRLARASELLISTDMSVKEAALRSGFDDALYFSRVFHKYFGMSPREMIYRHRLPGS